MTDSAPFPLPSLESNPNHPAFSQAREQRAEEVYTDAFLCMEDLQEAAALLARLNQRTPASEEFIRTYEEAIGLAETLHDELESAVTSSCPAAFRDWTARNRRAGR